MKFGMSLEKNCQTCHFNLDKTQILEGGTRLKTQAGEGEYSRGPSVCNPQV